MTLVRVLGKGRTEALDAAALAGLRARYRATAVDVGTGDGRFALRLATADEHRLAIGLDTLEEPMAEIAAKAVRKESKGGRPNLLLVRAAIEALPPELAGVADELYVVLPWGALLQGIVLARDDVLGGLAALCRPGARVSVTLNGEMWLGSTPVRYEHLPLPTQAHLNEVVGPGFARVGIDLLPPRDLTAEETRALPSTWARRLGDGREHPRFVQLDGVARVAGAEL